MLKVYKQEEIRRVPKAVQTRGHAPQKMFKFRVSRMDTFSK